jgi:uncharacterized protein (TIGR00296 family)
MLFLNFILLFVVTDRKKQLGANKFLYSRTSCYYTSVTREYIDIDNFHIDQLLHSSQFNNSASRLTNKTPSVSYVSIIFTKQSYIQPFGIRKINDLFTEYEKTALLGLAKETLYNHLLITQQLARVPSTLIKPINSDAFNLPLGVFITLYKHKNGKELQLRRCIGTLETNNDELSIESNVKKYVIDSAIHDTRFSSVKIDEFNHLEFSITILDSLKPITLNQYMTDKFQLGRDGILMKIGKQQGYFLPSVAIDLKLKKNEKGKLLDELCKEKVAGCDTKTLYRKNSNMQLYYIEGLEFHM